MRDGAHKIVELLRDHGYEAYFAGGCVRDLLLGSEPKDYDIATSARPDEVASIFHKTRKVGQHFGVVLVRMKGHEYEVATFRSDGPYSDGRHPDHVTFSDAEHDVLRRDFTINGLLYDPLEKRLLDYVEGQRDLDARTVRAIGEPERRFREDALRLLRAVRFAMRLEYEIEPETFAAIRRTASLIHCVSRERIRDELWQIFETPPISRALRLLDESTLLEQLFVGMPRAHHDRVRDRIATLLPCEGPLLALALVIVGWLEGEEVSDVAQNLRLSRHETRDLLALVEQQPRWQQYGELPLAARRRLLRLDGVEVHLVLLESVLRAEGRALDPVTAAREELQRTDEAKLRPAPLVDGHDLIRLGVPKGSIYKEILQQLEEHQLEESITTREEALAFVRRLTGGA